MIKYVRALNLLLFESVGNAKFTIWVLQQTGLVLVSHNDRASIYSLKLEYG